MSLKSLLPAAVLTIAATAVTAQEAAPLLRLQTSYSMYSIGVSMEDPLLIIAAARLRKTVRLEATERVPDDAAIVDEAAGQPLGWRDMLDMADELAAGDPLMEELGEDIRAERAKGVATGPVYSIMSIRGGGHDLYSDVQFSGGEYAEIYVEGASGTDLNIQVRDHKDRLVCSDTDISAIAYCGWQPIQDGNFSITVENKSGRGGQYSLITN
ncbi:MAG: hypothetical protein GY945_03070 [Rhodobacteraceae bacterium]|nr:hypothetical protein [Paracoccaceae bacterium]